MPQVRKPEVASRIRTAALESFAARGVEATSMAAIARAAGVATGNLYRYHPGGKASLLDAVLPDELAATHDRLITERVAALVLPDEGGPTPDDAATPAGPAAERLLRFWVDHRLEVVILLGRAEGTRFAGYGERFETQLVELGTARLAAAGAPPDAVARHLLEVLMAATRRTLAAILHAHHDEADLRRAVTGFWSYQVPGLDGLHRWATA
jgi:AcrR family transcriptional regulator